jgi:ATP-dependent RNA helicase RhlE
LNSFEQLGLSEQLLKALAEENYQNPTPIQTQAIPHVLAGRDLLGIAQTGTGKTAAFALPILHRLAANPKPAPRKSCRVLILSPTRELASQIADSFKVYGRHLRMTVAVVFGGVSPRSQIQTLARGVDILVATPGRLLDHVGSNAATLNEVEIVVLDEADQMLDMGFIHAIRKLVRVLPRERQNLFFSATMPGEIGKLASELLRDPVQVAVTPVATTVETIDQKVLFVDQPQKRALLAEILADQNMGRTLVFARTKHGADRVVRHLNACNIEAAAIHGNKSQSQRERALAAFREGSTRVLVATDIAARGIDVDGVTHVINFDLPNIPESYVHRIGRTARAGASGSAISFCDHEERSYLKDIEKLIRKQIPATDRRGTIAASAVSVAAEQTERHRDARRPQNSGQRHQGGRPNGGNRSERGPRQGANPERRQEARSNGQGEPRREATPGQQRERNQEGRRNDGNRSDFRGQRPGERPRGEQAAPRQEFRRDEAPRESRRENSRHDGSRPQGTRPENQRNHEGKPSRDRSPAQRGHSASSTEQRKPSSGERTPDRRNENGGQKPLQRPGNSGGKPHRFGRGGAPRRMGV